jgi:UDP-glucose 4-epimerase
VPLSRKRIFITGGAGFIGTTLALRLVDRNDVVALDNLHRDALSGTTLAEHPNFAFHQVDVLDLEAVRELALGATHIAHWATSEVFGTHAFNVSEGQVSTIGSVGYGPGQIGEGAIHAFIEAALADRHLTIHGDGSQIRAWCYVDGMVDGTLLCLERPEAIGQRSTSATRARP